MSTTKPYARQKRYAVAVTLDGATRLLAPYNVKHTADRALENAIALAEQAGLPATAELIELDYAYIERPHQKRFFEDLVPGSTARIETAEQAAKDAAKVATAKVVTPETDEKTTDVKLSDVAPENPPLKPKTEITGVKADKPLPKKPAAKATA